MMVGGCLKYLPNILSLAHNDKNIANTSTFLIKQVLSSYRWQGVEANHAYLQCATLRALQLQVWNS